MILDFKFEQALKKSADSELNSYKKLYLLIFVAFSFLSAKPTKTNSLIFNAATADSSIVRN